MFKLYFVIQLIASIAVITDAQISLSSVPCRSASTLKTDFRDGRIVGGTNAVRGSIPYIASLTRRGGHFCGATIINEQWLLTAAHCVCNGFGEIMPSHRIRAILGLHAISEFKNKENDNTIDNDFDRAYEIEFENIVVHPKYECKRTDNDIALLKISRPIEFTRTVQPICISSSSSEKIDSYDNKSVLISGWGNLAEEFATGNRPDVLQNAEVRVWSNNDCQASFDREKKSQKIQSTQMCAGKKVGGVDACWADSGGPMVSNENGLIGIVSTGIGCARPGLPGIYTRVSEYTQWIQSVVFAK